VVAFLRARGTPILVSQLGEEYPRPADLTGKLRKVLESDKRFQVHRAGRGDPTVQIRETPPKEVTATGGGERL